MCTLDVDMYNLLIPNELQTWFSVTGVTFTFTSSDSLRIEEVRQPTRSMCSGLRIKTSSRIDDLRDIFRTYVSKKDTIIAYIRI